MIDRLLIKSKRPHGSIELLSCSTTLAQGSGGIVLSFGSNRWNSSSTIRISSCLRISSSALPRFALAPLSNSCSKPRIPTASRANAKSKKRSKTGSAESVCGWIGSRLRAAFAAIATAIWLLPQPGNPCTRATGGPPGNHSSAKWRRTRSRCSPWNLLGI